MHIFTELTGLGSTADGEAVQRKKPSKEAPGTQAAKKARERRHTRPATSERAVNQMPRWQSAAGHKAVRAESLNATHRVNLDE